MKLQADTPTQRPHRPGHESDRIVVSLLDAQGTVRYQSESVTAALGYPAGELVGSPVNALVHPDDRARFDGALSALLARPGPGPVVEYRCRHRDGSWRYFQASGEHLPAGLGASPVVFTARDVTAARAHEERLRLLESVASHANDAILITEAEPIDLPGPRILYANPAFLLATGYTLDEVIGKTPRILQGPKTGAEPRARIREALKHWRPVVVELVNYRKDGTPFWSELSIVPVADETGWFTHWVAIQRDVTERKRGEAALRAAKDEAETANRAKSEFLSRMSHELRTPLNGVLGFAQILQLERLAGPHRAIVDDLFAAGKRLLELINEVLDISRVEAGALPMSLEPVPLADAVREALTLVAPLAAHRQIQAQAEIPEGVPVYVLADRQRLGQVLLNLVSNAVKYNRDGGSVAVAAERVPGGRVRIRVTDTGRGIPADKVGRLFAPFDRLGAESTGIEGTGLGLALCRRLVEAMNGTVGVESMADRGSTFWFEMPEADPPAAEPPQAAPADFGVAPAGARRVLYIEDNPANFRVIELALAHRPGVKLMAAMQGGLGADLAAQHRPDLILLDLHLPDLPGEEVLRRLRNDPATRAIPVVVLSADATPGQIARLRQTGAADYLTKPLDLRQFLRVLDEHMRRRPAGSPP